MGFLLRTTGTAAVEDLKSIAAFLYNDECACNVPQYLELATKDVSSTSDRPLRGDGTTLRAHLSNHTGVNNAAMLILLH